MSTRGGTHENNEPESIASILEALRTTSDLGQQLDRAQIWERWPEIVGPKLATHCQPAGIRDDTLTVEVENAIWMHRISYCKREMLARINQLLDQEDLAEIYLVLASEDPDPDSEIDLEKG